MKRTMLALVLVSALSFSAAACILFCDVAKANPVWVSYYPLEPVTTPPAVIFQSPMQNQTYEPNSTWLNFTIAKPESWFLQTNKSHDEQGNSLWHILVNITSVSYATDGHTQEKIPMCDLTRYIEPFPSRTLNFSTKLTLPVGVHTVVVNIEGQSFYFQPEMVVTYGPLKTRMTATSETITFTVAEPPPQEPTTTESPIAFPTETVAVASGASAVLIGACLLVYFKRRKR